MMTQNRLPADFGADWDGTEHDTEDDFHADDAKEEHKDRHKGSLSELHEDDIHDELVDNDEQNDSTAPIPTWSVSQLIRQLKNAPDDIPLNGYFALSGLTLTQIEPVRHEWNRIDVDVRRRTLEILVGAAGEYLEVELSALLMMALEDADAGIRQFVLNTIADNEPAPEMLGQIIQHLQCTEEDGVRAAAATALGYFILAGELDELEPALAMRAEESLIVVLTDSTEPLTVQCSALESIAYSGEIGVRQFIEDAFYAAEEALRVSALTAMGRSADIRWRRLVRAELRNPSAAMRAAAAIACGELEAKAALSDLLHLLEDPESPVRLAAILALGRIGGKEARRALEAIAASDEDEAEAAEVALEEMLFYAGPDAAALPLFDESEDEESLDDLDPWDAWPDDDDDDFGEYA